ncbi:MULTISPECIES: MT-A70 family methyltransferase [unclassified Rhizobium]|uniref:MT-A70 family methyltransferase n=1 Tax=unclassified Rhizobium TaxID=2613769 RepID=UPI001FEE15C8|nr:MULTISPECIES: MT-A70 family methyltransferase [unclassified Rhizobium]NMN73879.1 N6-adenosine-specific RNA methylase IME4 [Rhizobium sp. 57MFTsu3.2]
MIASGPYQLLPPLSKEDYDTLEADIIAHGVLVPVEYDEAGNILDGHHRVAICESLGLVDWPRFVRKGLSEDEKRAHARSLNLSRRHLSTIQKREVIEAQLKDNPELSSRAIADRLRVDHKTVAAARKRLEDGGEIPHQSAVKGRDGVNQPARKTIRTMFLPERANVSEMKHVVKSIRRAEQEQSHAVRTSLAAEIAAKADATPWWRSAGLHEGASYPVIYADPPWHFPKYSEVTGGAKSAENHYPTMSIDEICALGCPAPKQAVLFMWVTDLANGIRALREWGFEYKSFWGWKKIYPGRQTGTGYWGFDNLELLLIGTRGGFPAPLQGTQPIKCTDHSVEGHSKKPVWFAEQLERLFSDLPKLEMFQRKESLEDGDVRLRGNWSFWGNQAGSPESEAP